MAQRYRKYIKKGHVITISPLFIEVSDFQRLVKVENTKTDI